MADGNSFEGIFYVKVAPDIRYASDDGMFSVCYEVGKARIEFVMRPSVYLKAFRAADRAVAQFRERSEGSVSDIKSKAGH